MVFVAVICALGWMGGRQLPKKYTSEVLLFPGRNYSAKGSPDAGSVLGKLSGLASLIGFTPSSGSSREADTAYYLLYFKSIPFAKWTVKHYGLEKSLNFVDDKREVTAFLTEDQVVGLVKGAFQVAPVKLDTSYKLIVTTNNPHTSLRLAQILVQAMNEYIRNMLITTTETEINFLNEQVAKNQLIEVKALLYGIISERTKEMILVKSKPEYVFEVIDGPYLPKGPSSPQLKYMIILLFATSFIFAWACAIIYEYFWRKKRPSPFDLDS